MSYDELPDRPVPLWLKALIIISMLPLCAFPWLLSAMPEGAGTYMPRADSLDSMRNLLIAYPFFVLAAGLCAWKAYGRRPELTWIMLAVIILIHAGIWYLALSL
ncbi:MAG: hypothetical protein K2F63_01240 [Muribaculaceae bacterium]|nr:hypothetical protein [Muribaculaceae bacterium]MDE6135808.1 hypothetical protein [Muribaculaceae bacterium]